MAEQFIAHFNLLQNKTGLSLSRMPNGRVDLRGAREALDMQAIRAALMHNHGNRLAAAKELGIHKTTLFRKIRTLGIDRPSRARGPALRGQLCPTCRPGKSQNPPRASCNYSAAASSSTL